MRERAAEDPPVQEERAADSSAWTAREKRRASGVARGAARRIPSASAAPTARSTT